MQLDACFYIQLKHILCTIYITPSSSHSSLLAHQVDKKAVYSMIQQHCCSEAENKPFLVLSYTRRKMNFLLQKLLATKEKLSLGDRVAARVRRRAPFTYPFNALLLLIYGIISRGF